MTKFARKLLFAHLMMLVIFSFLGKHLITDGLQPIGADSSTVFFYHDYSEIYRNEDGSIIVYDGADEAAPSAVNPATTLLNCNNMQQVAYSFYTVTAYVGMVSWLTQPLSEDYSLVGTVTVYVWLSGGDVNTQISGYGVAVSDLDENGNFVGDPFYTYRYVDGKILSTEPTECSLSLTINHVFAKDHKLVFQVIVGSTTQGWMVDVYFDSPDRNSRAIIPGSPAIVLELEKETLTLVLVAALGATFFLSRRKKSQ